ncbi:MAG TPA: hypothetical protein VEX38_07795, partial [Fimbriimonadaceae bacterium]|nr:hypothetical protein [Fimbriimonadaceae bacterium]
YDETEIDNFGSGGLANHVLTILTGGTQESLVPFSYQLFRGQETGGGITDLWFSDNSFYTAKAGIVLNRTESPVQLIVEGISSTANVSSVKFMFEGGATANGVNRQLALFNYTLNEWVVISTGPATVADEVFEYTIPGSPAAYVNQSTRRLRARVSYHPTASVPRSWAARVDRMAWSITRP